jgi:hypothetical protein
MSVHPLPGASYHTIDTPLFACSDVDLEAKGSSDPRTLPIYTSNSPLPGQTPSIRTLRCRGPPVVLVLLLFCCFAFVVSAFTGLPANRSLLPDVPESHAWSENHISAAFRSQPYRSLVEENHEGALEILYAYYRVAHLLLIT